jgi:hypothetical protein
MNHSSVKHEKVMVNNISSHNNMNHSSAPESAPDIVVAVILSPITV